MSGEAPQLVQLLRPALCAFAVAACYGREFPLYGYVRTPVEPLKPFRTRGRVPQVAAGRVVVHRSRAAATLHHWLWRVMSCVRHAARR